MVKEKYFGGFYAGFGLSHFYTQKNIICEKVNSESYPTVFDNVDEFEIVEFGEEKKCGIFKGRLNFEFVLLDSKKLKFALKLFQNQNKLYMFIFLRLRIYIIFVCYIMILLIISSNVGKQ